MRLWEFDRLEVVGSTTPFDINKDARMLVSVVLGYLWMSEEDLGFDPTVVEDGRANAKRFQRRSRKERDAQREPGRDRLKLNQAQPHLDTGPFDWQSRQHGDG